MIRGGAALGVVLRTNHRVAALSHLALSHWLIIIMSHYLLEFRVFKL